MNGLVATENEQSGFYLPTDKATKDLVTERRFGGLHAASIEIEMAAAAGWEPQKIAVAIANLADGHMLSVSANWETEREIAEALKRVANGNGIT